jgi:cytochrome bd ubiquinol oxidase subunit I
MSDAVWLSRLQFAITIGFHFMFVTVSLGMVWLLFVTETMAWWTRREEWTRAAVFFGRMFITTFVFGVVTGMVMEFQFGLNWAAFSNFVGDIFGTPLAAEGLFTFVVESVFIGLYIFGRDRVPKAVHWFSILMVALGATFSAFWILVANSWMHTPAGYAMRNGKVELSNFSDVVFNESMWVRFFHTVDAVLIAGAFFVAGVSAYLLLRNKDVGLAKKTLRLSVVFGLIVSVLELYPFGDSSARQVAHTEPTKFAAMESVEKTQKGAGLVLFGIPVENPPHLDYAVRLPYALSLLAYRDAHATVKGFDQFSRDDLPPFTLTFASFHVMVGLGTFFIAVMVWAVVQLVRGRLFEKRWFLWVLVLSISLPIIACQFGWLTAEVGRQPWIVYGVMRTSDAASANVSAGQVLVSLWSFSILYLVLGVLYVLTMARHVRRGPQAVNAKKE